MYCGNASALQNHAGADVQETLHDLMTHPKEELDDASYMKLMYMKGLCYEEQEIKMRRAIAPCGCMQYRMHAQSQKNAPVFWTCRICMQ